MNHMRCSLKHKGHTLVVGRELGAVDGDLVGELVGLKQKINLINKL